MKSIHFVNKVIPINIEKYIAKTLLDVKYPFKKLNNKDYLKIKKNYKDITEELCQSLKNAYIKNNMLIRYVHLKINSSLISEDYVNSNVLLLSEKYDASPINIIRIVFTHRGLSKTEIKNLFRNPNKMNKYDKSQFLLAKEYDIYGIEDKNQLINSQKFEKEIEKILLKNNVQFKTQEELTKEQMKDNNVHSTPDFLIESELYINDKLVKWIDAKNFYGANTYFIKNGIKQQTKKYIDNYGYGCIIFKYGYSSKLHFNDILLTNL
jgi:hypothetical protein